jgi:hypothetical protein
MEHTRTTPQQSVILKKIGYDLPDTCYWLDHLTQGWIEEAGFVGEQCDYNNDYWWTYTRPKLADVATWLRSEHGWYVAVVAETKNKFWTYIVTDCEGFEYHSAKDYNITSFNSHDLSLSHGIDFILTKLNEDE